jgi:hypothetical protein
MLQLTGAGKHKRRWVGREQGMIAYSAKSQQLHAALELQGQGPGATKRMAV